MNQKDILEKLGCSKELLSYIELSDEDDSFEIPDYDSIFEVDPVAVSHIDIDLNQIIVAGNMGLCEQGAAANEGMQRSAVDLKGPDL